MEKKKGFIDFIDLAHLLTVYTWKIINVHHSIFSFD